MRRRELEFLLYELLQAHTLCQGPYADHSRPVFDAVLDTAMRLAEDKFEPHAAKLDANEPHFDGQHVHIIPEVKQALDAYVEAGFMGASFPEDAGGMQLPYLISQATSAIFHAANVSTAAYTMLTQGAANLLRVFGNDSQRDRYMKPLIEGRFFGTMCLSEPQAGSSLGDLTTRAQPDKDGLYQITGQKMWISGGEHDLSENIIHLVLARLPDAPAGVKGISLFVVPKRRLQPDGTPGSHNDVHLAGLNHKMGYRGTVNTVLSFGDHGQCLGELVGEPHKGLTYMFHMMNEARIAVGLGAAALGYTGFLRALDYAKERTQGRSASNQDKTAPPIAIIEHADVKRMLLAQKSFSEGGLALCLYCARLVDELTLTTDPDQRKAQEAVLGLLTPIAKAWPSKYGPEANDLAIQVHGGYGYTREYIVERLYRDNRLNPIHEGTNGIQAMDLLGRKVARSQGKAPLLLLGQIRADIQCADHERIKPFAQALSQACDHVTQTTVTLLQQGAALGPARFLANASAYLDMLGHIVVAWLWLKQATVAQNALDDPNTPDKDRDYYQGKVLTCQYFMRWELPRTKAWGELLASMDDTCLTTPPSCL